MPAAPAPPAPKVDLPPGVLQPKSQPLIDAAMKSGEAMANQVEVCSECEKCPQCAQLHWEQIQVGEASSYLGAQTEKFWKDLQKSFQDGAEAYDRAIRRPAWDRWIGASFWYQSASALVNSMAADNPWVFSGVGLDPSKISFTPHPGWIEVPLGTGTRCWVADESLIGLAHQAASAAATYEAYMAAVADLNAACNELSNAEAAYKVAEATYDAKMQQLRDWFDAEGSKFVDTLNDLRARSRRLDAALAACRTKCQQDVAKESANILVAVLSGLGVVGVTLGSLLVAIGQPFDSGSNTAIASSASTAASTTAAPTSSSSASTSSTSTVAAVEVPDIAPDDVMIDMFMRGMHGVTAFPGVDFAPFLGEGEQTKFALTPAEPLFRTSFYSETLDELGMFPGVLGPPINVTGTAVTSLDFVTPRADPVNDIFNRYGTTGETLWAPFVPSGTLPGMTAFTLQMDGNVADPSFCDGREFQFAFNIFDPAYGEPFAALPQYPADYYDGGNYFAWFGMRDCQLGGGFSQGSTLTPTDVTGGAFLSTDGTGSTLTFFLPTPPSGPDASVYMILFEYPGTTFQPDNTRFQSVPDILGPATSLSTAIVTSDCNFTLAPQSPPTTATSATTPATTATPPSVTSGGGGTPSGGSGTDGTGTGTATGTGTGAGTGTAVAADPDETRPGVVTGGVASAALGGTALAAA
ncbi:MAG: hypothetical protein KDB12_13285, partial [Ilumatobacter sp.]|nr:hypothetical protein [Ilumatobacter sp.]